MHTSARLKRCCVLIARFASGLTDPGDTLTRWCAVSLPRHSYMIMDFMETDLHKIIYSKNELTDEHIQVSNNGSGVIV